MIRVEARDICKSFGDMHIFKNINFGVSSGESLAITGANGSGKTTLLKMICGLLRPSQGEIRVSDNGQQIPGESLYRSIGLVGPYLELYEELTARENMQFVAKMRKIVNPEDRTQALLDNFNLTGREDDPVKTYSSGMRQRLKYVFALLHQPRILLLDEPTSNLDSEGIEKVYQIMGEQKKDNILIFATNDQADLKLGDAQIAVTR